MRMGRRVWANGAVSIFLSVAGAVPAAAPRLLGGELRADLPFPEFAMLWREGWKLQDEHGQRVRYARPDMPLGGYLHAFIRNDSDQTLNIQDVLLNGVSLGKAIAPDGPGRNRDDRFASSIAFAKLSPEQLATLQALGEPVWFKADPFAVPPHGSAEIVVRLRRAPSVAEARLRIAHEGGGIEGTISLTAKAPRIVGVGFAPLLDRAFIYAQHPQAGRRITSVTLDGVDVSKTAVPAHDPRLAVAPVVIPLQPAAREGDYRFIECGYDDGTTARSSVRVDGTGFVYGMWGGFQSRSTLDEDGAKYIEDLRRHHINTIMEQYGGDVRKYVRSAAGQADCARLGMRIMDHATNGYPNQRYVFLHDEPDAKDVKMENLPLDKRLGTRGQWLVGLGRKFRGEAPTTLQLLNIDNTFKPENWYTYAQLPDIACADPYFQEQLHSVYEVDPGNLSLYTKPTYVYAAGAIYQSACAPKPMHLILTTCRLIAPERPFRPPTPEEKRVELYYAIAAGARGISFWWYSVGDRFHGLGSDAPEMRQLFAEIGLVGAEFQTAESVLLRACPAVLPLKTTPMLWAKTLLAGADTVVLVAVNDNIGCDRAGMAVTPLENARAVVKLPAWVQVRDTFEITADGIKDVATHSVDAGLSVELGHVDMTRLVMVTENPDLRAELQKRYESRFADSVRALRALSAK